MEKPLLHPLSIGPVHLENNLGLAPMAGTTDLAFRRICRRYGAGLTITELVSARGICHDPQLRRNWRYLAIDPAELPVGIQLFGSDPADFDQAIAIILAHPVLGQCSLIDLNMGCPVNKVVRSGEGAALMRTPDLAARIIERSVRAAAAGNKPVTVKFRKGWDEGNSNAVEFARLCESAGAAALTIHGRTRQQMYGGKADWTVIGEVKAAVGIPVYGNGDATSPEAIRQLILATGVDGVMIGRAAQGNPWLFRQAAEVLAANGAAAKPMLPPPSERVPVILEHLDGLIALNGESVAVREMRKQLIFYFKGTPQGATLKNKAMTAANRQEILAVLDEWRIYFTNYCEYS